MIRLDMRVEVLVSRIEAEDDVAMVYKKAVEQKTTENQMVITEDENCSLAQMMANRVIREVCTAPC
jgi:cobalamin biosynthesis protein CbiD